MRPNSVVILVSDGLARDFLAGWCRDRGISVAWADDRTDIVEAIAAADAGALITDRLHRIGFRRISIEELRTRCPGIRIVAVPVRGYLEGDMERLAMVVGADEILADPRASEAGGKPPERGGT